MSGNAKDDGGVEEGVACGEGGGAGGAGVGGGAGLDEGGEGVGEVVEGGVLGSELLIGWGVGAEAGWGGV